MAQHDCYLVMPSVPIGTKMRLSRPAGGISEMVSPQPLYAYANMDLIGARSATKL